MSDIVNLEPDDDAPIRSLPQGDTTLDMDAPLLTCDEHGHEPRAFINRYTRAEVTLCVRCGRPA